MAPRYSHPVYKTVLACVLFHSCKKFEDDTNSVFTSSMQNIKEFGRDTGGGDSGQEEVKSTIVFGHHNLLQKLQIKAVTQLIIKYLPRRFLCITPLPIASRIKKKKSSAEENTFLVENNLCRTCLFVSLHCLQSCCHCDNENQNLQFRLYPTYTWKVSTSLPS